MNNVITITMGSGSVPPLDYEQLKQHLEASSDNTLLLRADDGTWALILQDSGAFKVVADEAGWGLESTPDVARAITIAHTAVVRNEA